MSTRTRTVVTYLDGKIKSETWRMGNKLYRRDGPTHQKWYHNGQIKSEIWYKNNRQHRPDAPAHQEWYSTAQINQNLDITWHLFLNVAFIYIN
jgi:antitoxin component YwqK of YwqJK toxin-antitoxin module|uniref:Uncharacterized protein n=1 Tax=viral metagenome TaxID=1070528 RepID=A0A6C0IUD9_9ZZZZ